ncbi:MAG: DUF5522 domain-containing protein [Bacteroidota bacterium]
MRKRKTNTSTPQTVFVEGVDYYIEDGKYVFTAHYLKNRGFCCSNGCRHCPYENKDKKEKEK